VLDVRGRRDLATARVLINATGLGSSCFHGRIARDFAGAGAVRQGQPHRVRRLFEHDRGYVFQTHDRRIVFALPFERDFTLIGTTDKAFAGDPSGVEADADEVAYLCGVANQYLRARIGTADVVWSFAGVRSLYDTARSARRTYRAIMS